MFLTQNLTNKSNKKKIINKKGYSHESSIIKQIKDN